MTSFIKIAKLSELKVNSIKQVEISGLNIALFNIDGKIFATSNTCTHEECNLSDGFLNGQIVECPCHGGKYNVTSGKVIALPPTVPVKVYKTRIIHDYIEVEI